MGRPDITRDIPDFKERVARLYAEGQGLVGIATYLGVGPSTVRAHLMAQGVEIRPRGGHNHTAKRRG